MKLSAHIDYIRILINKSFSNLFVELGFNDDRIINPENVPNLNIKKRNRIEELINNYIGETGDYINARTKAIEELSFTLFNRIAAIKVMEANMLFPEIITKRSENGSRSFGHKRWLEENSEMRNAELESIRDYIKSAFNSLADEIALYSKNYPFAYIPNSIEINEIIEAFNLVEKDIDNEPDIWKSDDILGWLYEAYNNFKKQEHKESGEKTEYNKVSVQSQVYTPRWVVEFLVNNSLGKLYLEMFPNSEIKHKYKIANPPQTRVRDKKPLHLIKMLDPASGSGNFIFYGFDLFYDLYLDQIENYGADYDEDQIPNLIIENNLFGIDLDDRAVQIAQLGLFIKAKKKNNSVKISKFNIISSDFYLPKYQDVKHIFEDNQSLDKNQKNVISDLWTDLRQAHKFGSLIKLDEKLSVRLHGAQEQIDNTIVNIFAKQDVENYQKFRESFFFNLRIAVQKFASEKGVSFLSSKTADAIEFLNILSQKYDIATANPPYTDGASFGTELKTFVENNYKKPDNFSTNLYAAFIKRNAELTNENGKIAMIHPLTFMYIKTFEDVRKFILDKFHINVFVEYGLSNLFGGIMADPAFYVLEKGIKTSEKAWFISLNQYTRTPNEKNKKDFCLNALSNFIENKEDKHNYTLAQSKLKIIKSFPFIYWISDEFREKFKTSDINENLSPAQGAATTDNNRFLRFWWEVDKNDISIDYENDELKWVFYSKGGPYNKWFGNLWLTLNYSENGKELKSAGAVLRNSDLYFKEGTTYSASGAKGASFRYLPTNCIFDTGGSSIFANKKFKNVLYLLAFMNTKLSAYISDCLNPTVNAQVGDMQRIPFVIPEEKTEKEVENLAKNCVEIKKYINTFSIIETNYEKSPLQFSQNFDLQNRIKEYFNYENHLLAQVLINETIINEKIFEIYELSPTDKAMVLEKEGESIGGLPVEKEALEAFSDFQNFQNLENLPLAKFDVAEFSEDEKQTIISEFPTLYKSNNDLEEFCIRHKVNPINVWYWFSQSNTIPKQRMQTIGMEFLADIIRQILMEDDDGIAPLVRNSGEEILLDRIEKKFYQLGFTQAQYSSFDNIIGRDLNDYINTRFFAELSDHLNLFMYLPKTPFIWHITSGKHRAFECYIIIYKWNKDKLFSIKSMYVEKRESSLINKLSDLQNAETAQAQNEKELIKNQLTELQTFKTKIDELISSGYNPKLDDGVAKNIAPLQKSGLIPYEVLKKEQLKKYLNAEW